MVRNEREFRFGKTVASFDHCKTGLGVQNMFQLNSFAPKIVRKAWHRERIEQTNHVAAFMEILTGDTRFLASKRSSALKALSTTEISTAFRTAPLIQLSQIVCCMLMDKIAEQRPRPRSFCWPLENNSFPENREESTSPQRYGRVLRPAFFSNLSEASSRSRISQAHDPTERRESLNRSPTRRSSGHAIKGR
jgi:hypothetical protein